MPTLTIKQSKASPAAKSKAVTAKPTARASKAPVKKPDMKAWAVRRLASLKEQYGEAVTPDSEGLWEHLRSDASCPSA